MERGDHEALEKRIVEALERGDLHAATTEGVRGFGPEIFGYLVALLRDRTAANDAFDVFGEELWRGIRRFRREASFRTWAYGIAWNVAQRSLRDRRRQRVRRLATTEISRIVEEVRSSTAPHLETAAKDRLARLRAELDPFEQTLLILRIDRGLSWKEVTDVLGEGGGEPLREATVRKRFARLREKLRRAAEAEG